jgi:acetylornithine deacetylase
MKGGLAAGIGALWALRDLAVGLRGHVVFQSVVDEETGGPGTRTAVERHPADAAIVLEPTAGSIMPVEGGVEWLHVRVRGVSGHSALRYRSVHAGGQGTAVNAIEKAVKILAAVQELERHWGNRKVHPLLPKGITTLNPGMIAGGSPALSNMADECTLGLSLKYLPGEQAADVRREFEEYVAAVAATDPWLRDHPPEIEWGVGAVSFAPAEISLEHPLALAVGRAHRAILGEPEWRGFEAVSDLAWLAEAGVPGLLYGPGDAAQAHSSAEYVEIDDLVGATKVVALAVAGWCGVA